MTIAIDFEPFFSYIITNSYQKRVVAMKLACSKLYVIATTVLTISTLAFSQFDDRSMYSSSKVIVKEETYFSKPIQIIDMPTASMLRPGSFRASVRVFEQGGLLASLSAGISRKLMFGVSYGGLNIIGEKQSVEWNSVPGVHFMYRITDESLSLPSIVIGFDSQNYGPLYSSDSTTINYSAELGDRYQFKSRGFFLTVSKGYSSFVNTGLHAGISYSIDKSQDGNNVPTLFMASDIHFTSDLAFLFEYDFALNDAKHYSKGILNIGLRWAFTSSIFFDFDIQNFLGTKDGVSDVRRIIKMTYYGSILK